MEYLLIDAEKCKADLICSRECPQQILVSDKPGAPPVMLTGGQERCIRCGHCVAVCPYGALSLNGFLSPQDCQNVNPDMLPEPQNVFHFLSSRRSIRSFRKTAVSREVISELLHIAQYAPSGHNRQPVKWMVIEGSDKVEQLSQFTADWIKQLLEQVPEVARSLHMDVLLQDWERGLDRIGRGAPNLVLAYAPENIPGADTACTLALNYLELAAHASKIGACWAGFITSAVNGSPAMNEMLAIPSGCRVYGAMLLGYPRNTFQRIPLRKKPEIIWR